MLDILDTGEYPQFLRDFLRYLRTVLGRSENTIVVYNETISELLHFMQHFKLEASIEDSIKNISVDFLKTITITDLYEYLYYIDIVKKNSASTRSKKMSAIRTFFKFLSTSENVLEVNPAINLTFPKAKKSLPKYLKIDEALQLLNSITGKYKERDYAMLLLFLTCGMRLQELVNIDIKDVRTNSLVITGKGNKERTVYLPDTCKKAIKDYIKVRPNNDIIDRDALFISRNRRRITCRMVENIVKKYIKAIGLDGLGFSAHKLRHTAATLMYQEGHVDIRLLQEILGHVNLATTQIYTHVGSEQLKDAIDANPLAKI